MLLPLAFLLGAFVGWRRAVARGGDRLDGLQYAAGHAILFVLVALAGSILLQRLGVI
jgi:hypothetical protein